MTRDRFIWRFSSFIAALVRQALSKPLLDYAPEGWKTPLQCQPDEVWNSPTVVEAEKTKWDTFRSLIAGHGPLGLCHEHSDPSFNRHVPFHNINITYGYVLAVASHMKTRLSVLDYGGGLGHYYLLGKSLLPSVELSYHCKEVPKMAEIGRLLCPEISWHTDDACLNDTYEMVMIGGSLQYIENWQQQLLAIASASRDFLYITGVPTFDGGPSFVAIQHAYGKQLLHWQFNRDELLQTVITSGFRVVREFVLEDCPYIKNAPHQCTMSGWLFKRNE